MESRARKRVGDVVNIKKPMMFLKAVGIWAAVGAAIPALWIAYGYICQAMDNPWGAPMELIFAVMYLWPMEFDFFEMTREMSGNGPLHSRYASIAALILWSLFFNAAMYAVVGSVAWLVLNKLLRPAMRRIAGDAGRKSTSV